MLIEKTLNYTFKHNNLLEHALTHPSYYSGKAPKHEMNQFERLEFLGDRVLGLIVADMLYTAFPQEAEGELARRHANLVCKETLAEVAEKFGVDTQLKYSRANDNNPTQWLTLLSDAMEALIGAVYIDGGYKQAATVINTHWDHLLHAKGASQKDPKTALQEWVQSRLKVLPIYTLIEKTGPAHAPQIQTECQVQNHKVTATASSKKLAEIACAKKMLTLLQTQQSK